MRLTIILSLSGTLLAAGCGDDSETTPDSATGIDAAGDATVDAAPEFKGYNADEGGEVRAEYIRFPNGGVATRTTAFFYKDPGSTKYFPYLDLNGCTNMTGKDKWPMAQNPIEERDYYDIGGEVIISGGPEPLVVKKRMTPLNDPYGRNHPAGGWYYDPASNMDMDGGTYLSDKTLYDVTLPGSEEFPGTFFDDVFYMPSDFALETPGLAGPLSFPANTAQTFSWTTPADAPPAGFEVLGLVAFTGANGPAVICVEPNDGEITVPAEMMDVARTAYPTGGSVARQTLTHAVREMVDADGPTGKRIDFFGVWCYAGTTYTTN